MAESAAAGPEAPGGAAPVEVAPGGAAPVEVAPDGAAPLAAASAGAAPVGAVGVAVPAPLRTAPATAEPATAEPDLVEQPVAHSDRPWVTIVWDDPVNLMNYVTHVFMKVFGYSQERATALMLDVHTKGRAVVSSGPRERMELDVSRLHGFGLWATLSHDS